MFKSLLLILTIIIGFNLLIPTVYAASHNSSSKPKQTVLLGNDISYPQCSKSYPKNQAFGIVGINGGLANTTNPCLSSELTWAKGSVGGTNQPITQLYINTADPGGVSGITDWPQNNTDPSGNITANPYGTCDGTNSLACSWQYGWNRAVEDVQTRFIPAVQSTGLSNNPSSYPWWLDVETTNSWESDTSQNAADLEGMVAYIQSLGATVGIYSTSSQWTQIAGTVNAISSLNSLNNWLPGARTLSAAISNCSLPPLTAKGKVIITQYTSSLMDYDNSCI
ncbi:MAG TPA: hypothetical protein VND99_05750 [Candidatus Acidoferrales bacterium]|nr:hypothetical protein [Candidatus Acidoferrales bacterium]